MNIRQVLWDGREEYIVEELESNDIDYWQVTPETEFTFPESGKTGRFSGAYYSQPELTVDYTMKG